MQQSGRNNDNVAFWAGLGGATGKNAERALDRRAKHLYGCKLEPFHIDITLKSADGVGSVVQSLA
eukprot:8854508-Alexandrium_andersonii.AAC.1